MYVSFPEVSYKSDYRLSFVKAIAMTSYFSYIAKQLPNDHRITQELSFKHMELVRISRMVTASL